MVFDSVSSNIDEILLISPSANVFVFGDFNVHHKDWLTHSGGTDRPGELCHNFSVSNDLTQMVNFPNRSLTVTLTFLLCWMYFFFWHKYLFYNAFPSSGKFQSCWCLSFHWLSNKLKTGCPVSSHSLWLFLCRLRCLLDHLRDVPF